MSENLSIKLVPNPILREKSREVTEDELGEELNAHMDNMIQKMKALNGVGLSGVQVGDLRRIMVVDPGEGALKMVNPEILEASEEKIMYTEGCLSVPGMRLGVERSKTIKVKFLTPFGQELEAELSDLEAVIIQHEMDHLEGETLYNKVSNLNRNIYMRKLKKIQKKISRSMKANKKTSRRSKRK